MIIAITLITILGFSALGCGIWYLIKRISLGSDYYEDAMYFGIAFWVLGVIWLIAFASIAGMSLSEQNVSGVVYNTKNNKALSGNTSFSVRASEDTYVSEKNKSSYCLPPNSPYKELVNRAAADKRIKVVVTTSKYFKFKAPWTCVNNVTVTEVKQ